jgi:hypothetical protein
VADSSGKVAIPWKVVYTEDNDDSTSGKELAEQGYTLPEYHFVAEYDGAESGESLVLEVRGWIENILKDKDTKAQIGNRKYTLILPDNTEIEGQTNEDGVINQRDLPEGEYYILIHDED